MLKLVFGSRWYVQLVLALAAFGAAVFFYLTAQQIEAEKAKALAAGMPAPVSLSAFDPARDVHAADEVHVTAWINPDHNYQLTKERRKSMDTVRRMFVLFGPDDTPDSKSVRAVVLMPEHDVERFLEGVLTSISGQVGGNPVFALSGMGKRSATLDEMADDALAEKGLTKAPGFRYLEIWPVGGREAGLAPDPETGLTVALGIAALGGVLLLIAGVKFSRRHTTSGLSNGAMAPAGFAGIGRADQGFPNTAALTQSPNLPTQAPKKRGLLPPPQSLAFLGLAVAIGVASSWTGQWYLMVLALAMGAFHFVMRVKTAMDKGVATVASALVQAKTELANNRLADPSLAGTGPVMRPQSPVGRLSEFGRTTPGKKVAQLALVVMIVLGAPLLLNDNVLGKIGLPSAVTTFSSDMPPDQPAAPEVPAKAAVGDITAPPEPPVVKADVAAGVDPLIPEAASLRPKQGEAGAPPAAAPVEVAVSLAPAPVETADPPLPVTDATAAPLEPAPVEIAAPLKPAPVETADPPAPVAAVAPLAPASLETAAPVAPVSTPVTEAAAETPHETATAEVEQTAPAAATEPALAEEEAKIAFLSGLGIGSLGNLLVLAPVIGAVALAIAALALMRGRQANPPAAFAGRDPWGKLAQQARATAAA